MTHHSMPTQSVLPDVVAVVDLHTSLTLSLRLCVCTACPIFHTCQCAAYTRRTQHLPTYIPNTYTPTRLDLSGYLVWAGMYYGVSGYKVETVFLL